MGKLYIKGFIEPGRKTKVIDGKTYKCELYVSLGAPLTYDISDRRSLIKLLGSLGLTEINDEFQLQLRRNQPGTLENQSSKLRKIGIKGLLIDINRY